MENQILFVTGSATLVFGQTQNEAKTSDNSNINENSNDTLTGSQQVPPVQTKGFGTASFELLKDNKNFALSIRCNIYSKYNWNSHSSR